MHSGICMSKPFCICDDDDDETFRNQSNICIKIHYDNIIIYVSKYPNEYINDRVASDCLKIGSFLTHFFVNYVSEAKVVPLLNFLLQ